MTSLPGSGPCQIGPTGCPSASAVSVAKPRRTAASYDLSLALRNCDSRVARPTTTSSTPVAAGSSVPVCPTRFSRSSRRTRDTTSCEVGPAGLSTMSRPSIVSGDVLAGLGGIHGRDRLIDPLDEQLLQRVDRPAHRAAGGVLVAAAAELFRDRADVDCALGPHADAVLIALVLLEENHGLDLLDRERQVDQPLGVL